MINDHTKQRVDQIKENIKLHEVIRDYGLHPFSYDIDDFQMPCPFHGADKNPSSHVYADGWFHCYACHRHYDVIDFIKEKEGIEKFSNVLRFIEQKYGLKKIKFEKEFELKLPGFEQKSHSDISPDDLFKVLEKKLIRHKKDLGLERYSKLFFVLDTGKQQEKIDLMFKVKEKLSEFIE